MCAACKEGIVLISCSIFQLRKQVLQNMKCMCHNSISVSVNGKSTVT